MQPSSTRAWWITASCLAVAHFLALASVIYYCLDKYYEQPCPLDVVGQGLLMPAYLLFPIARSCSILLVPLNSFLWGCILAEPLRWWFGWPAWRFSVRTLLVVMTLVSVLLGLAALAGGE